MIKANDPSLVSWVEVKQNSDFPIQNLPLQVEIPEALLLALRQYKTTQQ